MEDRYGIGERLLRAAIVVGVGLLILGGLAVWLAVIAPSTFKGVALAHLAEQALIYALPALGMGLVLIVDEADLSVAGVASLAAAVAYRLAFDGLPGATAMAIALSVGLLVGLLNGALIGLLRLPFYVVTAATWVLAQALSAAIAGDYVLTRRWQPWGSLLHPLLVVNLVGLAAGVGVLFILGRFTSLERLRSLNARLGLQGRPGRLSLGLYKLGAYGLSGLLAAGAGLALLNLLGTFVPGGYGDLTFVAIAAAVIGGALLWRGSTRLIGAPLGALVIVAIRQVVMRLTLLGRRLFGGPLREMLLCALLVLVLAVVWWVADWLLNRAFGRSKQMPAGQ